MVHDMDVVQNLTPGKNGSNRFVERDADDLNAARYRHNADKPISHAPAELIVERKHTSPQTRAQPLKDARVLVFVRVGFSRKRHATGIARTGHQ